MSEATVSKSNTRYAEAGNKDLLVKTKVIESRLEVLNFLQEVSSENLWRILVDGVSSTRGGHPVNNLTDFTQEKKFSGSTWSSEEREVFRAKNKKLQEELMDNEDTKAYFSTIWDV